MLNSLIYTLTDREFLASALAAFAAFATILTLAGPLLASDQLGKRMKEVAARREELRQKAREALSKRGQLRSGPSGGFMKGFVEQLNLRRAFESQELRDKLAQAGLRGQGPLITYLFFRFLAPFIVFAAALLYLFFVAGFGLPGPMKFLVALAFAGLGFYAPDIFISNLITRRQQAISEVFPDALDLLLICVESGMSIEAAFNKVAAEVGSSSVELAAELGLLTAELSYLPDRRLAYENLSKRVGLPGVKAVVTSLIQAERYGTPLGTALRVMAQENRDMRLMAAEKKAAALPAKLTVPMIVFFLPPLFVVILGPAGLRIMGG